MPCVKDRGQLMWGSSLCLLVSLKSGSSSLVASVFYALSHLIGFFFFETEPLCVAKADLDLMILPRLQSNAPMLDNPATVASLAIGCLHGLHCLRILQEDNPAHTMWVLGTY